MRTDKNELPKPAVAGIIIALVAALGIAGAMDVSDHELAAKHKKTAAELTER